MTSTAHPTARRRASVAVALAAATVVAVPAAASAAAPSIQAAPNPTTAGDPVVVYGTASPNAKVTLYHRISGQSSFTKLGSRTADSAGRYAFSRADGVVTTNRNWYVRSSGDRSPIVHEKVAARVVVNGPDGGQLTTGSSYTFKGSVTGPHRGDRVELQRQSSTSSSDSWHTIDRTRVGAGGRFVIDHRFRNPGDANLRVKLPADAHNVASASSPVGYAVSQRQNADLTIASSADPLDVGGTTTITGTVAGVTTPTPVTLYAHTANRGFAPVAQTTTDASGNYSIAQAPVSSTFYRVAALDRRSAILFEGVRSVVSATASSTSATVGDTVTFTGSVTPDKSGHVVVLQRKNADGSGWHEVGRSRIASGSTYTLKHRMAVAGSKTFRVLVPGGPDNQTGASAPIDVSVAASATPLS